MKKGIIGVVVAAALLVPAANAASPGLIVTGMGKLGPSQNASCSSIAQGCLAGTGTFRGHPIARGSFVGRFTVNWSRGTTKNGVTCASGGGSLNIQDAAGNELELSETGKVCKGGTSKYAYRFNGSYSIVGGANKYAQDGVGNGKASWQLLPDNRIRVNAAGGFSLTTRQSQ